MPADPPRSEPAHWLTRATGQRALTEAQALWATTAHDPLTTAQRLRSEAGLTAEQSAEALSQVTLREAAATRYGLEATDLLLTRDGLEAATRPSVAAHRAEMMRRSGVTRVLDLTGGLGFDTRAFLAAGLAVTAVERDATIAQFLAHNCPGAEVVVADVTAPGALDDLLAALAPTDAVFADPARRDPHGPRDATTARARPERDPERWSPPWSWVLGIPHPRIAAKVSPAFTPPPSWQAQWISVDRTVVECALYSWDAAGVERSAVMVTPDGVVTVPAEAGLSPAHANSLAVWLHEIDPAVLRAGALPSLAEAQGMALLDPASSWCTSEHAVQHPAVRSHRVIAVLDGSTRAQRRQLHDLGVTRATVKSRDVPASPATVLRDLGLREGLDSVLVLTQLNGHRVTAVVEPVQR